ncbi:MAG: hypothetical protein ACLTYW_03240 [Collinsella sp.]
MAEVFPQREVAVCRELTKLHEEVLRGPAAQLPRSCVPRRGKGRDCAGHRAAE